jgi:hypothetical protein
MPNWRMLGPQSVAQQTRTVNGRTYSATAGQEIDVPDFDGQPLQANGWVFVAPSGPSSARPTGTVGQYPAIAGCEFFDTTLNYVIRYDGATWRNPATGAAV